MSTIPLNGDAPLGYRIGLSDRPLGQAAAVPDGFLVLNQTNNNVFKAQGGVWVDATGTFPSDLLDAWFATIPGIPPSGYRIGTSDRPIGDPATAPEDFFVVNTTNNKVFQVISGTWSDVTSTFNSTVLADVIAAWKAA